MNAPSEPIHPCPQPTIFVVCSRKIGIERSGSGGEQLRGQVPHVDEAAAGGGVAHGAAQLLDVARPGVGAQGAGGGVAWWAHIGGFIAGVALIVPMKRKNVALFDRGLKRFTLRPGASRRTRIPKSGHSGPKGPWS